MAVLVSVSPISVVQAQGTGVGGLGSGVVDLSFDSTAFELRPVIYWRNSMAPEGERVPNPNTILPSTLAFARVQVASDDGTAASAVFKVEGQPDQSQYQFCDGPSSAQVCHDALVGVTNGTRPGVLYLYTLTRHNTRERIKPPAADFPAQTVELSATKLSDADVATSLKVYREVLVTPSSEWSSKDCSDFPDENEARFTCLFLREISLTEAPTTTAAMRTALPDLVQADSEYNLVFAEEFNVSTPNPDHACASGVSALDAHVWDMTLHCGTDSTDTLCTNVVDGHMVMAHTAKCGFGMTTDGGFSYKYGYVEIKYTLTLYSTAGYTNYNFLVGGEQHPKHLFPRYGVTIDSDEAAGKYLGSVINVLEHEPVRKRVQNHTNLNHALVGTGTRDSSFHRSTTRQLIFCRVRTSHYTGEIVHIALLHRCIDGTQVTVVRSVEWTPRGYRDFLKVEGVNDDLFVLQPTNIVLYEKARPRIGADVQNTRLSDAAKNQHIEHLVPGSANSVLVNYAVGHAPLALNMGAWGFSNTLQTIASKFEIDYIRVFQPNNLYRDMEPVYN